MNDVLSQLMNVDKKMETEISIVKPGVPEELEQLISVFADVFNMQDLTPPTRIHLQGLLSKDTFFAVIAKSENKVIGGLTVYILDQYYSKKPWAYIFDLAVLANYQRQGIGRKLIAFTNDYCKKKGYEGVFVQADKIDDYAVEFYRSTRPTNEEDVIHFDYRLSNDGSA